MTESLNEPIVVFDVVLGRKRIAVQEDVDVLEAKVLALTLAADAHERRWNPERGHQW